jgi:hypothetical protein
LHGRGFVRGFFAPVKPDDARFRASTPIAPIARAKRAPRTDDMPKRFFDVEIDRHAARPKTATMHTTPAQNPSRHREESPENAAWVPRPLMRETGC